MWLVQLVEVVGYSSLVKSDSTFIAVFRLEGTGSLGIETSSREIHFTKLWLGVLLWYFREMASHFVSHTIGAKVEFGRIPLSCETTNTTTSNKPPSCILPCFRCTELVLMPYVKRCAFEQHSSHTENLLVS